MIAARRTPDQAVIHRPTGARRAGVAIVVFAFSCRSDSWKYEPTGHEYDVGIVAEDLGASPAQLSAEGARAWDESPSTGRFPLGVAVAQVLVAQRSADGRRCLHVCEGSAERGVLWGHLLDSLPTVRELVLIDRDGFDPRGFAYRDVLRQSVRLGCHLCLIYARLDDTAYHAEYVGTLWDAAEEKLLSTYRVPMELTLADCDGDEDAFNRGELKKEWLFEADFRAEADLRRMVLDDVWALASRDKPSSTQPSPWKTDQPLLPRDLSRLKFFLLPERTGKP